MAAKVRDYAKLAANIKDQVGESNIISAAHCATRLRLVLKEFQPPEGGRTDGVVSVVQRHIRGILSTEGDRKHNIQQVLGGSEKGGDGQLVGFYLADGSGTRGV